MTLTRGGLKYAEENLSPLPLNPSQVLIKNAVNPFGDVTYDIIFCCILRLLL